MQTQENTKTLDQQFKEETGIDVFQKKRGINLDPVIGMGVTRSIGSDSYPFTIIDILNVKDKTILKIERDHSEYEHNAPYKAREKEIEYLEQYIDNRGRTSYKDIKWNKKSNSRAILEILSPFSILFLCETTEKEAKASFFNAFTRSKAFGLMRLSI